MPRARHAAACRFERSAPSTHGLGVRAGAVDVREGLLPDLVLPPRHVEPLGVDRQQDQRLAHVLVVAAGRPPHLRPVRGMEEPLVLEGPPSGGRGVGARLLRLFPVRHRRDVEDPHARIVAPRLRRPVPEVHRNSAEPSQKCNAAALATLGGLGAPLDGSAVSTLRRLGAVRLHFCDGSAGVRGVGVRRGRRLSRMPAVSCSGSRAASWPRQPNTLAPSSSCTSSGSAPGLSATRPVAPAWRCSAQSQAARRISVVRSEGR